VSESRQLSSMSLMMSRFSDRVRVKNEVCEASKVKVCVCVCVCE
jgi:hypothetical protein